MYKYKQTTDVEVGDLVVWTKLSPSITNRINNKVYKVIGEPADYGIVILNEDGAEKLYGKAHGFKVLQTKPASEAVVGDYMYRITSGSNTFPQHSVVKITQTGNERLGYSEELGVDFYEVIVIAQAEPEVTYPLFMQSVEYENILVKFIANTKGTCMLNGTYEAGHYSSSLEPHQSKFWKSCDFTIQPDIDDIDWWQARYKAGLPIYVRDVNGNINMCNLLSPKGWGKDYTFGMTYSSLVQQAPIPNLCNEIALGATMDCSLQPTKKEQPMNKTTLKLLLELLGASEEVKDATNSKFVGIITNEDEYVGYMYFDSKEDATECMAQPKMELHKLHLFEKSCVLAQKPRKVIEV